MKEIKFLLTLLAAAGYTSVIWIAALWQNPAAIVIGALCTAALIASAIIYLALNWKKED